MSETTQPAKTASAQTAEKLPADKDAQLVFYCGGPSCPLAGASAEKAMSASYTNVSVFREGISGWQSTASGQKS